MPTDNENIFTTINGQEHLLNPTDGKYYPVVDVRAKHAVKGRAKSPEELAFEQAFEQRRRLRARKGGQDDERPVPGGVGYGSHYNDTYRTNFQKGTRISVDIICPQTAGGNVNTWLYLTETNRSAKGVEALVYYNGQSELGFMVYDWAREDHWQVTMSAAELKDYLDVKNISDVDRQVLLILNETFVVDTTEGAIRWMNRVFLFNRGTQSYDLVYDYIYNATDEEQKSRDVGFWGPIVETFQDVYSGTNPLGFYGTYMAELDGNGQWTPYYLLTDEDSYIRNDGKGFKLEFLQPNHSFAVI